MLVTSEFLSECLLCACSSALHLLCLLRLWDCVWRPQCTYYKLCIADVSTKTQPTVSEVFRIGMILQNLARTLTAYRDMTLMRDRSKCCTLRLRETRPLASYEGRTMHVSRLSSNCITKRIPISEILGFLHLQQTYL